MAHEFRFRRVLVATSVVISLLVLILAFQFTWHAGIPAHVTAAALVLCLGLQARSMIQPPAIKQETEDDLKTKVVSSVSCSMWWPPQKTPATLAFWSSIGTGVLLLIWWGDEALRWPLNAMLGVTAVHTLVVHSAHLGFVSSARELESLHNARYSFKRV
eukprot:TRINITY_DN10414_c0_g1_i2.p1 TRINITY_DN10414_c0_g1~~TRINITY_DN10414_c0_g1_i2.p1  ORF type:complete len:159 (-),score=21.70 TRINITY_DN10414_c0_g1_i2:199-675(-)